MATNSGENASARVVGESVPVSPIVLLPHKRLVSEILRRKLTASPLPLLLLPRTADRLQP